MPADVDIAKFKATMIPAIMRVAIAAKRFFVSPEGSAEAVACRELIESLETLVDKIDGLE